MKGLKKTRFKFRRCLPLHNLNKKSLKINTYESFRAILKLVRSATWKKFWSELFDDVGINVEKQLFKNLFDQILQDAYIPGSEP